MSGSLESISSVIQDEDIRRRMCRTPKTPIKTGCQTSWRKSESKRSLFQSNSPAKSDDLGLMAPLSPLSNSSRESINSPQFSPNGKFCTPPRISGKENISSTSGKSSRKIEIKSSLFPDLKVFTPKSRQSSRTPKTLVRKECTPESQGSSVKSMIMSRTQLKRRELFKDCVVSDTDSSPSGCSVNQENEEDFPDNSLSDGPTILGIKPLSCENFYGPPAKPQKAHTKLLIDTLEPRSTKKELMRSLSIDSLSSNKSFVSGGSRKKAGSSDLHNSTRQKSSSRIHRKPSRRTKGLQAGVWHNIKKPKQIKKIQKMEKPLISPKSRLAKMLQSSGTKEIKVKEKSLFQENPRKRTAQVRKRIRNDFDDDEVFDNFTKKKKLSTSQSKMHPAVTSPETINPDPNKKFVKYGQTRKATFTLNDSVKLQISDGVMKLQTPKKRRKLYSGKKDTFEDFNDYEDENNGIQSSIEGILSILEDKKDSNKTEIQLSSNSQPQKLSSLEGASARSPLKTVSNLPTLIINDFDSDEDGNSDLEKTPTYEKKSNETTLEKTGNVVSYVTNILVNNVNDSLNTEFEESDTENLSPNKNKMYSLFYKQNWSKYSTTNNNDHSKSVSHKKTILVPDDQYLLDAGQESVGIVVCKKCGVMYQAGDFADEATHNNFHNHLPELKFTGWNNERVVGRYSDGRVIMILNADPKVWWQKVSKIVEVVDQELGFPEASVQSLFYKTVYLYINDSAKQIAGCLIAEECKVAYKMFPPLEGVEIDSCSKDPSPCRIGISRIWTALSHRRKGVASRMIECLQKTFFFGEIVSLDQIAFSVPSPSGKLLAQSVTGKLDFLVYGFP